MGSLSVIRYVEMTGGISRLVKELLPAFFGAVTSSTLSSMLGGLHSAFTKMLAVYVVLATPTATVSCILSGIAKDPGRRGKGDFSEQALMILSLSKANYLKRRRLADRGLSCPLCCEEIKLRTQSSRPSELYPTLWLKSKNRAGQWLIFVVQGCL